MNKLIIKLISFFSVKVYAMPRTVDEDPLQKFQFRVLIPGYPDIGFMSVGGLTRETNVVEYLEGTYQYAHKLAGREKISELTFTRGAYASQEPEKLYFETLKDHLHRKNITLQILNRYGDVKREYILAEAWASKVEVSELDASSDDVIVDTLTIQFEYFLNDNNMDYQTVY